MIIVWWHGWGPLALAFLALIAIASGLGASIEGPVWSQWFRPWFLPWVPLALLIVCGFICRKTDAILTKDDSLAAKDGSWLDWLEYYPHSLFFIPLRWWGSLMMVAGFAFGVGAAIRRVFP